MGSLAGPRGDRTVPLNTITHRARRIFYTFRNSTRGGMPILFISQGVPGG